jgi:hypothetical protein
VGFGITDQLLIRFFFAFVTYWRKDVTTMRQEEADVVAPN